MKKKLCAPRFWLLLIGAALMIALSFALDAHPVVTGVLLGVGAWLALWAVLHLVFSDHLFRRSFDNVHTYLALIIVSAIFVFPCLWLILSSLSKSGSLYDFQGFFPPEYSVQTFIDLFTDDVQGLYPY